MSASDISAVLTGAACVAIGWLVGEYFDSTELGFAAGIFSLSVAR